jgi:hypothetical protein
MVIQSSEKEFHMTTPPASEPVVEIVEEKKHKRRSPMFWPLILIFVGVILFIQNLNIANLRFNWWAVFIFIPVVGSLTGAWAAYRKSGKVNAVVRSSLGSALVVATVAVMLLFDMNWSRWWPLMVIAPGVSLFLSGFSGIDTEKHKNVAALVGMNLWLGIAVILLGIGFLAVTLPIPAISSYLTPFRWWAIPILIAGLGAFVSALVVFFRNDTSMNWTAWAFTGAGLAISATGVFALLGLTWGLLGPIILIAVGIVVLSGILIKR